jgi:hypothetical protein
VILAAVLAVIALAAAFLGIRALRSSDQPSGPMYFLIVLLGILALATIIAVFFYTIRKRVMQEKLGGTMMGWLQSHVYLGILAVLAALAHAFLFPLSFGLSSGMFSLIILVILVISGALWRVVYARVPPQVPGDVGNLSISDSRDRALERRIELDKLKVGKSREFQEAVDALVEGRAHPAQVEQMVMGLEPAEREAWAQVQHLIALLHSESVRENKQRRYAKTLQLWRAVHLPLAALLLVGVAVHLFSVFNLGSFFQGEAEKKFAASEDCATCHGEIVDEWKLSLHRNAQSSTITVAQTEAALDNDSSVGKICVNCHAPIGTKFSQSATFPVGSDPGANPVGVEEEGITCVVCHTMPEAPDELDGFGELPLEEKGFLRLGTMVGPPLDGEEGVPNSAHDFDTGFMRDPVASSDLCGACHNVFADPQDPTNKDLGLAPNNSDRVDIGNDEILDENVIDKNNNLVLQTTFNEWEDFITASGGAGASCVDCHMPPKEPAPIADGPPALSAPDRDRNEHTFVGVDYELNTEYYEQGGMPSDALERVLEEREDLLQTSVTITGETPPEGFVDDPGVLTSVFHIRNNTGHSFPTGFAFARQFWLEVSAETSSGEPVCLLPVGDIPSPCASGQIGAADEDLKTCDAQPLGAIEDQTFDVQLLDASPLDDCDPWLVNFQKLLTDGGQQGAGVLVERAFQTLAAGAVKDRVRTVSDPLNGDTQVIAAIPHGQADRFAYQFDVRGVPQGESVRVTAVLHFRHLPPYFVRALENFLPEDLTADELLANMTVVDVASNKELDESGTNPDPETLSARAHRRAVAAGKADVTPGTSEAGGPWGAVPVLAVVFVFPLIAGLRRLRRRDP